jgi:hypothetical protein
MAIKQHVNFPNLVFRHSLFGNGAATNRIGAQALKFGARLFFCNAAIKKYSNAKQALNPIL